ncbi:MAG: diguanylate cyclase [Candidatus Omnitrophota bacterium]
MENSKLKKELGRIKTELWLLYEISNAMRTTLKLPEILYIILTAVTSKEGLGFNRAMLFLTSEKSKTLEGVMAIGPIDDADAKRIWSYIEKEGLHLAKLIDIYHNIEKYIKDAPLNNIVKDIRIPLNEGGGILATTALEGMNFKITSKKARENANDPILEKLHSFPCVCVPLKGQHRVVGTLLVDNMITKKTITNDDIHILSMIADQAALAIENSILYEEARLQANIDSLTKVWNHGYFQYLLKKTLEEKAQAKKPVSLAMMDLDNFKAYNDELGHQNGDEFLKTVAYLFRGHLRKQDSLCRYGGEEFAIIMPDIAKQEAFYIIERLRKLVEGLSKKMQTKHKKTYPLVSISSGIASYPDDGKTKTQLITKADKALYDAKHRGKNKTCLA